MKTLNDEHPVILVRFLDGCNADLWQGALYDIEEEGIPYQISQVNDTDTVAAAYNTALQSPLQVGIACDRQEMVVHFKNLQPDSPLYRLTLAGPAQDDTLRSLGNNAARLVKGLPLKPM